MSAADPMPVGDLEWDSKPGRRASPTRGYAVPPLRPREPSPHVGPGYPLLDDGTRLAIATEQRRRDLSRARERRSRWQVVA